MTDPAIRTPTPITGAEARALTDKIKATVEDLWQLIAHAYRTGAWTALGFSSWADYCQEEFGTDRIKVPIGERPAVVAMLAEAGMSRREIAAGTGMGYGTVARAGDPNGSAREWEKIRSSFEAFLGAMRKFGPISGSHSEQVREWAVEMLDIVAKAEAAAETSDGAA